MTLESFVNSPRNVRQFTFLGSTRLGPGYQAVLNPLMSIKVAPPTHSVQQQHLPGVLAPTEEMESAGNELGKPLLTPAEERAFLLGVQLFGKSFATIQILVSRPVRSKILKKS